MSETEGRKLPTLMELVDRYIPRHTRTEVLEMAFKHEERVTALLLMIHEYRERLQKAHERMAEMEREYYEKARIPINYGNFEAACVINQMDFRAKNFAVRWSPDPLQLSIRVSEQAMLDAKETPYLFEAVGKQFEEAVKADLIPKLRREYMKLYDQFQRN